MGWKWGGGSVICDGQYQRNKIFPYKKFDKGKGVRAGKNGDQEKKTWRSIWIPPKQDCNLWNFLFAEKNLRDLTLIHKSYLVASIIIMRSSFMRIPPTSLSHFKLQDDKRIELLSKEMKANVLIFLFLTLSISINQLLVSTRNVSALTPFAVRHFSSLTISCV